MCLNDNFEKTKIFEIFYLLYVIIFKAACTCAICRNGTVAQWFAQVLGNQTNLLYTHRIAHGTRSISQFCDRTNSVVQRN